MTVAKKTILTLTILFLAIAVQSQEIRTLNQCIRYALENNLEYQSFQLEEQNAKIDVAQSKMDLLPSVSARLSADKNFGRSIDPNTNDVVTTSFFSNYNSLNSTIGVFQGFTRLNRISYSQFMEEAAHWQRINFSDKLAFDVLMNYYDIIYYQGMVDLNRKQVELSEKNLKKVERQAESGVKAKADVFEIQATFEKEKLMLLQAENKLEEVKQKLKLAMNLPFEENLEVASDEADNVALAAEVIQSETLYHAFSENSPYVQIARSQLNAANKKVSIMRGYYLPTLFVYPSIGSGYYETNVDENGNVIAFRNQLDNNMSEYIGATLSIPIFSKNAVRNSVRKAKIEQQQAQNTLETYQLSVYNEIVTNTRQLEAFYHEYLQSEKQLEANEMAYQVAEKKFDKGLISIIEVLTVKNRLAESEAQLLLSKLQWKIKQKTVLFYQGKRFWEIEKN